jgi:hypothetical protein
VALSVALVALPLVGCGDDETTNGNGNGDPALLGTWIATSITIVGQPGAGDLVVDDELNFSINFNSLGEYAILVTNDDPADPWICENTATCEFDGTYRVSGSTLILDESTSDETTAVFSISDNIMTATLDATATLGVSFAIVFEKI